MGIQDQQVSLAELGVLDELGELDVLGELDELDG